MPSLQQPHTQLTPVLMLVASRALAIPRSFGDPGILTAPETPASSEALAYPEVIAL